MATNDLEITLTLNDLVTAGLKNASKTLDDFGDKVKRVGREASELGSKLTIVGGAVVGSFTIALRQASQTSITVKTELERLNVTMQKFYVQVANDILPTLSKFTHFISTLYQKFKQIDEPTRNMVLNFTLIGGAITLLLGLFASFVGKIILITGAFVSLSAGMVSFIGTIGLVGIAIGGLIVLMFKFKPVADVVMSTFETMFRFLLTGFTTIKINFENTLASMLETVDRFSNILGKMPTIFGVVVSKFGDEIRSTSETLREMSRNDLEELRVQIDKINEIITTGSGEWSENFDNLKDTMVKLKGIFDEFNVPVETLKTKLEEMFDKINQKAGELGIVFRDKLSTAIGKVATEGGKFKDEMEAIFKSIAATIIKELVNGALQLLLNKLKEIAKVQSGGGGIFGRVFGVARSFLGFSEGGFVGGGGTRIPLPSFADGGIVGSLRGSGPAIPVLAHEGEVIGTPERLSRAGIGAKEINIYIQNAQMDSAIGIEQTAEELGFAVERSLRTARGI